MSEAHEQESGTSGGLSWILLLVLPLLYVLSIGPVGAFAKGNPGLFTKTRVIYYPVILLHNHTPLRKPLEAYARLWGWQ
jgi:hypothetical protein